MHRTEPLTTIVNAALASAVRALVPGSHAAARPVVPFLPLPLEALDDALLLAAWVTLRRGRLRPLRLRFRVLLRLSHHHVDLLRLDLPLALSLLGLDSHQHLANVLDLQSSQRHEDGEVSLVLAFDPSQ